MVSGIIIIVATMSTAQVNAQPATCYFDELNQYEFVIQKIEKESFVVFPIKNKRKINHAGDRCRIITRNPFNLDMIRKSLHPV